MLKRFLCAVLFIALLLPAIGLTERLYIIPDSNERQLTREELWKYQYDTLMFAFNEIYARHGYKFEAGSPCYMWFSMMPWYTPNESESSTNHHETYEKCNSIENYNVDLIKSVRAEMRALGTLNPEGEGMPEPPDPGMDKLAGFEFIPLKTGQTFDVMSAPSRAAYQANNGKAAVNTNGAVYARGWDNGWLLMLYEASAINQYRVGYIEGSKIKGRVQSLPQLTWEWQTCQLQSAVYLTDDPIQTGNPLTWLSAGTTVTYLTTIYNSSSWDYVEITIDGKQARGFIPHGSLNIDMETEDEDG